MFQSGDLVLCIDDSPKKGPIAAIVPIHHLIRRGRVYRVASVGRSRFGKLLLGIEGIDLPPPMLGFAPYRFRKIKPADDDFGELLGRMKAPLPAELEPVG